MKVEYFKHNVEQPDIDNVVKVLSSLFLTTAGVTAEFERQFSEYTGQKHTIGVTNCTAALHLSLLACGIRPGDEVITTPMTFIASSNSILYTGATPVYVDVEPETGNINAALIEQAITHKTKAIIPVHLYGQLCDMKSIRQIAGKHNLHIIEDAAHSIEAKREGIGPGQLGDLACFSFYATKNITSGEGGAITTDNSELAETLMKLRLHGMSKGAADRYHKKYEHWDMELLGWKYNMFDIQAALLINQLEKIESRLQRREEICRRYEDAFADVSGLRTMKVLPDSRSSRYLFTIVVSPEKRDDILEKLQQGGIGVAVNFRAVHLLKYYREKFGFQRGMFPEAELIGDGTITLPLYPKLADEEVDYVIDTLKSLF